jgi:hypothetical protein
MLCFKVRVLSSENRAGRSIIYKFCFFSIIFLNEEHMQLFSDLFGNYFNQLFLFLHILSKLRRDPYSTEFLGSKNQIFG